MKWIFWGILAGAIIAAPSLWRAHAETPDRHVNVCYALRHGANVADIENALTAAGYPPADAGTLAGRELRDHCPDQIDNVTGQVGYE